MDKSTAIGRWYNELVEGPAHRREASRRLGHGATIPAAFAEAKARQAFFDALYLLVPASTRDLAAPEARALHWRWNAAFHRAYAATGPDGPYGKDPVLRTIRAEKDAFIRDWQQRYQLTNDWCAEYANSVIGTAAMLWLNHIIEYAAPISRHSWDEPDLYSGKFPPTYVHQLTADGEFTPNHRLYDVPVYLADLKHPPQVEYNAAGEPISEWADDDWFDSFDSRAEDINSATDRLLETLRPRVRRALEAIEAEDRELNDGIAPVTLPGPNAFEWLVRYQVIGDDMDEIAEAAGVSGQAVSKAIHKAKNAIGLALRPRSKPGPKPGKSQNRAR